VRLDVEIDAYLPEAYIADPDQRISFYKRLADLAETGAISVLAGELRDRYGRLPEAAQNLLRVKEVRLLAEAAGVEHVRIRAHEATFRFVAGREPGPEIVKEIVRASPASLSFQADGREGLRILLRPPEGQDAWQSSEALLRAAGASDTLHVSHVSTEWEE
jgi:transcription-repair coupling factor (superfamily II helicase)